MVDKKLDYLFTLVAERKYVLNSQKSERLISISEIYKKPNRKNIKKFFSVKVLRTAFRAVAGKIEYSIS